LPNMKMFGLDTGIAGSSTQPFGSAYIDAPEK
jgi:hypothetical protein